jgi:hypothetical protein
MSALEREIIIPHTPESGPVTAVKNVLLQTSLTQLQDNGYYDRYAKLVDQKVLQELASSLGPGWIPIAIADAHYAACEALNLTTEEISRMGTRVGGRVQETALVSAAKGRPGPDFDLWTDAIRPMHRMWPRIYQGGSVQIVKLAPKVQECQMLGFGLVRHRYFRQASLTVITATHAAMGALIDSSKIMSFDAAQGELTVRLSWA